MCGAVDVDPVYNNVVCNGSTTFPKNSPSRSFGCECDSYA